MALDRRKSPRRAMGTLGWIVIGDMTPIECRLWDISADGAKIIVNPEGIPDQFFLLLNQSGTVDRKCQILWRGRQELGVLFIRALDALSPMSAPKETPVQDLSVLDA